jgi:hypothetical protein
MSRFISETTIESGVSVNNVTDCFSSDYDIYQVIVSNVLATGNDRLDIRFINSSDSVVTGDYDNATLEFKVDGVFNPYDSTSYTFTNSSGYGGFVGDSGGTENINNKGIGILKEQSVITGISLMHSGTTSGTTGKIKVYGLRVDS